MIVTVLGSGTSMGVPVIAQPPGLCDLEDARNWRTRSSIHLEADGYHLQVDAAPEFRIQCLDNGITAVDAFILTHGHADHILGMDDLRRFCDLNGGEALPVYSTPEGLQRVRDVFPYAIRDRARVRGYPAFRLEPIPAYLELGPFAIRHALLPHGDIVVLGLLIHDTTNNSRLAYFTDCGDVPTEAIELARSADCLIIDGLRQEPHPSHLSIDQAVAFAREIGATRSYLTHLSAKVDHARQERYLPSNVRLAFDGLRLEM